MDAHRVLDGDPQRVGAIIDREGIPAPGARQALVVAHRGTIHIVGHFGDDGAGVQLWPDDSVDIAVLARGDDLEMGRDLLHLFQGALSDGRQQSLKRVPGAGCGLTVTMAHHGR